MQIGDLQFDIEQSLANLKTSALPPALEGLRHLPLGGHEPRVSIRGRDGGRKVRRDADASYFDPESCEVVIQFVPSDHPHDEFAPRRPDASEAEGDSAGAFDHETATDQLLDALAEAERSREFVGLKWFRDQYLRAHGYDWARDPRASGALLRRATEQRLILTSQIPNPNNPLHPVTAIRVNRRHPRFNAESPPRRAGFQRVRIRGGSIADTVISDRR